jgi:nucleoside-diphosphate-sugar epimerase
MYRNIAAILLSCLLLLNGSTDIKLMRIAVTGGTGFIGRYVLPLLIAQGHEVVAATRSRQDEMKDGVQWVKANLLERTDIEKFMKTSQPEGMIHLAWYAEHGCFWNAAENFAWCKATADLLELFRDIGGRRVVIGGSCAEYDWSYGSYTEDKTPTIPRTIYGKCKDVTRQYAQTFCQSNGIEFVWGRIFFPYGPGEPTQRLLPSVLTALNSRKTVKCSHGFQFRDFIHVSDTASALVHLLTLMKDTGIFNIGSGIPIQLRSVVKLCASQFNYSPVIHFGAVPVPEDDPLMLVAKIEKLCSAGWRPTVTIEEGIDNYFYFIKKRL